MYMLEKLYKKGYLNYEKLILENAKALGLNAEEGFLLIHILKNYLITNTLAISDIAKQVLLTPAKLDKLIASLMERGYYEVYLSYDNGKGTECISFRPLFKKLEYLLEQKTVPDTYNIEKTIQYITAKMNRVLIASELEALQSLMMEDRYSYDQIAAVVDSIIASKKSLSMKSILQGLSNKVYDVHPSKEAPQAFKDFIKRI